MKMLNDLVWFAPQIALISWGIMFLAGIWFMVRVHRLSRVQREDRPRRKDD